MTTKLQLELEIKEAEAKYTQAVKDYKVIKRKLDDVETVVIDSKLALDRAKEKLYNWLQTNEQPDQDYDTSPV